MALNRRGEVRIAIRKMSREVLGGEGSHGGLPLPEMDEILSRAEGIYVEYTRRLFDEGDVLYIRKTVDEFKKNITSHFGKGETSSQRAKRTFTKATTMCRNQALEYGCEFSELSDAERLEYVDNEESCTGTQFSSNIRSYDLDVANVDLSITQLRACVGFKISRSFVGGKMIQVLQYADRKIVFVPMLKVGC